MWICTEYSNDKFLITHIILTCSMPEFYKSSSGYLTWVYTPHNAQINQKAPFHSQKIHTIYSSAAPNTHHRNKPATLYHNGGPWNKKTITYTH